ncbi:MAG: glycoside hydrolase, family 16 [Capsulimonas sp.]|jgi:beta-glucanase (GH16 family)|nr:glycoside hydrolase, family 16 [Capsulimonas sp.]
MTSRHRLFAASAAAGLILSLGASAQAAPPAGYTLAWSDEFHKDVGAQADESSWNLETGPNHANAELEIYTNDQEHGHIVADPRATDGRAFQILSTTGKQYESVRMTTAHKKPFQYGFVEARIQLPYGQGIWPAFWMLGENIGQVGWPRCGEIDIMENIGMKSWANLNLSSLHSASAAPPHGDLIKNDPYTLPKGQIFTNSYHLFQMQWVKDSIAFYIDGNLYETRTAAEYGENPYPFNAPFFFLINTAVGGSWPGNPDKTTVFPQKMLIDYVRVYKGAPKTPPAPRSLRSAPGDSRQILLSWPSDINATSYNVYRSAKRGAPAGKPIATGVAAQPFVDSGLTPKTKYFYRIAAVNGAGVSKLSSDIAAIAPPISESPYLGVAATIPGVVQMENYDKGGEGVAFHDTDAKNNGNAYRPLQGVDVEASGNVGEGFHIGWTADGEWIKYTVSVKQPGKYTVTFRAGVAGNGGSFHLENAKGVNLTGPITVGDTGGWRNWVPVKAQLTLPAGKQTLKLVEDHAGYNLDSMTFTRS